MEASRTVLIDVWRDHEKLRFVSVGAWNTLFAYLAFIGLYLLLQRQLHYLLICVLAHSLSVCNAFICQRLLVFRSRTPWLPAFLRFNVVQLLVLVWGLSGLAILVEIAHVNPFLAQMVVMSVGIAATYLLNRSYAFRG